MLILEISLTFSYMHRSIIKKKKTEKMHTHTFLMIFFLIDIRKEDEIVFSFFFFGGGARGRENII